MSFFFYWVCKYCGGVSPGLTGKCVCGKKTVDDFHLYKTMEGDILLVSEEAV